jgi:hypothetical protein
VIRREDVLNGLFDACPSFKSSPWCSEYQAEFASEPEPLDYILASAFIRHLVDLHVAGREEEFLAVFRFFETLHLNGDDYVKELATIGFLEDLQNSNLHHSGSSPDDFLTFLGPHSRWWWEELHLSWTGQLDGPVGSSGRPRPA